MTTESSIIFRHEELTRIVGEPSPSTLQNLQRELWANLSPLQSNEGGAMHGHLALIHSPHAYMALAGVAFVPPLNPGPDPIPANVSRQITENARIHAQQTKEYQRYTIIVAKTKMQLEKAIEPVFWAHLMHPIRALSDHSIFDLLQYLNITFGTVTDADIKRNSEKLASPWNPDEPIETLWARTNECDLFADTNHVPISEREKTSIIFNVIKATGVFGLYVNQWEMQTQAQKTYANLQVHFKRANTARINELTVATAGFHGAHAANHQQPSVSNGTTLPIATALAATTISAPTTTTPAPTVRMIEQPSDAYLVWYCHTCGPSFSKNHTSKNCGVPGPNHRRDATIRNRLGGSEIFRPPRARNNNNNNRNNNNNEN